MKLLLCPLKGCLGVILGVTSAVSVQAQTATATFQQGVNGYTNTSDTHISAAAVTSRFPNNTAVLVDNDNPIAHGLIRFDNIFGNGPGQVPPNATILSASLTLRTSNDGDPVWFHRMLVPWDETNNWNELATSGPGLQADDVEMAAAPEFTFTGTPSPRVDTFDVTAIVQAWFAGTFPNYGWGITNQIANGWQFDSSENTTIANRPILSIVYDAPCTPVTIVTQPASTNANELSDVTFSVVAAGTEPMFQWFKDGNPIQDATNATFTITRVREADEGTYTVSIVNACSGPINSANAVLTVNSDTVPPEVLFAYGTNDNTTIFVVFSEIVVNAADPANYQVFLTSDPATQLGVGTATYADPAATEGTVVVLTLNTPWTPGQSYSMTASAVSDIVGNPNDPAEVTPIFLYATRIFSLDDQQMWRFESSGTDIGESWKQSGFNDVNWTNGPALLGFEPDEPELLPEPIRTPVNRMDAGGTVIRTYYFRTHFNYPGPAGEGILRFRTVLDDAAAIYVNGAEVWRIRLPQGPLNYLTAGVGDAIGNGGYEGPFTVRATNLVAGDNVLAVEVHQTGNNSSDMVWGMDLFSVATAVTPLTIVTQPVGTNVTEPAPFRLSVVVNGSSPSYQWYHNGVPIDGATGASYIVNSSDCEVHTGDYFVIVTNEAPSTITSRTVRVNVACDVSAPAIACVYGTNDVVVIEFSENVTMEWEFASANLVLRPVGGGPALEWSSVTNTSATNFGTTIVATISPSTPRDPNVAYQIEISGIVDLATPPNPLAPATIAVPFHATPVPLLVSTAQWRYNTTGTDLGTGWFATGYNDSTWAVGNALFDAKRVPAGDPPRTNVSGVPVTTQTTLSNAANTAQIPTHYFRTHFNYSGPPSATLELKAMVDDGTVWYLNGEEIFRNRMPSTPITYSTLATNTVNDATNEFFYVCVDNLVNGDNVLAVELHQSALDSSDLTFGVQVSAYTATPPPPSARLTITRGTGGQINISWTGSGVVLQESSNLATHPNGWSNVAGVVGNSYQTTATTGNRFFRLAPAQ